MRYAALVAWTMLFALLLPPPPGRAATAAPLPTVGQPITLTATIPPRSFPQLLLKTVYSFSARLFPSGQTFQIPSENNVATWSPSKAGDYRFRVLVTHGAAHGSATVDQYHVKPSLVSSVTLHADPPAKALPGNYSFRAHVSVPALKPIPLPTMPAVHRLWCMYQRQFIAEPVTWEGPVDSVSATKVWQPNPPLIQGLYLVSAYVQSFRHNVLIAEGKGWSTTSPPQSFYRGYYAVLLPPAPCPGPTSTSDPAQPFGWVTPITEQNALGESIASPQGAADCAIAGYSIEDITS